MKKKYKFVNRIRDKSGAVRNYFRPPGGESARLSDAFGSHQFESEHARLLRDYEDTQQKIETVRAKPIKSAAAVGFMPGSLGAFIGEWSASSDFKSKAPMTQYCYGKALDYLRDRLGSGRFQEMTTENVDRHTRSIKSASAADLQVNMISMLWQFAKGHDHFKPGQRPNPAIEAKKRYGVKHPHDQWDPKVEQAFLAIAKPHARLLFWLLRETGQRLGDVANMKWAHYDGETILIARTEKTKKPVFVAVGEKLREILDATPRDCEHILSKAAKPLKKGTLSHLIGRTLNKIGYGRRGSAEEVYSAHGLRKSFAVEYAMTGVNTKGMQASLGHASAKMSLYYAEMANNKRLALDARKTVDAARKRAGAVAQDDVIDMTAARRMVSFR